MNLELRSKIQKVKNIFHLVLAIIANFWYGFPSKKIKVIGVTGTDGKTTTTHLIYHILKQAGKNVSMISTVYGIVGNREFNTGLHTTTPNPFLIQKLFKNAVQDKDEYFVLETTSHGLDQNRIFGIKFEMGLITNVTHEHLDYHLTYEDYLRAKLKLLFLSKIGIINADDKSYKLITQNSKIKNQEFNSKLKLISYGIKNKADVQWNNKILTNLLGEFNRQNILAAYSVCMTIGILEETILSGIKNFIAPTGRLELVYSKDFKVIIDFAHTPNAFLQVLPEIKKKYLNFSGKLIHVFGAAGLRDHTKRSLMGEVSTRFADIVILTEEDYRTEDIKKICQEIAKGLETNEFKEVDAKKLVKNSNKIYTVIVNREEAIKKAIEITKKNDVILITGKAHEKSLCRGKIEYPWDEKETVKKLLKKI